MTTTRDTPPPCSQGLRCPNPTECDHTFRHPDTSVNRLHADDWFLDPKDPESWETATEVTDEEGALARLNQALWACKLDCTMRLECLAGGMSEPFGVRGGYTADQRRQIQRDNAKKQASATGR
jgi:hypothetical protein